MKSIQCARMDGHIFWSVDFKAISYLKCGFSSVGLSFFSYEEIINFFQRGNSLLTIGDHHRTTKMCIPTICTVVWVR